jgi:hypothetical protein
MPVQVTQHQACRRWGRVWESPASRPGDLDRKFQQVYLVPNTLVLERAKAVRLDPWGLSTMQTRDRQKRQMKP